MAEKILRFLSQYIVALISVIVTGILFWKLSPEDTISAEVFVYTIVPLGLYMIVTFPQQIKYWSKQDLGRELPKLKAIKDDICLFSSSDLFSTGCFVSIFYLDDYEKMIGYGKVETVKSDNGMLQIIVSEFNDGYDFEFMSKNRKNIILKPTCPYEKIMTLVEHFNKGE